MRRVRGDDGAVAIMVAALAMGLLAFSVLVVDVGALYVERRQLQNGADAAALALAQSCAVTSCGDASAQRATTQPYADGNTRDGATNIRDICGADYPKLELAKCTDPETTAPGAGFVRVRTQTGTAGTAEKLPPLLAMVIDPTYAGHTVGASAVANWGSPGGTKSSLPFTFGDCEWEYYTKNGLTYPSFVPPAWPGPEAKVFLADGAPVDCPGKPAGTDTGGGFGWLGGDGDTCTETTVVDGFVGSLTGAGSHGCKYGSLIGTTVHVPVFDCHTDTDIEDPDLTLGPPKTCHGRGDPADKGTSVQYHIDGYAAFFVTGMNLPGNNHKSIVTLDNPCPGKKCISGYFIKGLLPSGGPITSGTTSYGSFVVGLAQ